jgi:hypothetical protein
LIRDYIYQAVTSVKTVQNKSSFLSERFHFYWLGLKREQLFNIFLVQEKIEMLSLSITANRSGVSDSAHSGSSISSESVFGSGTGSRVLMNQN